MIDDDRNSPKNVDTSRYSGALRSGRYRRCSSSVTTAMKSRHSAKNIAELIMADRAEVS
jgi:hypothetical protein